MGNLFEFMNVGQPSENVMGTQILFRDNRNVKFRKLPIKHTCLCEIDSNKKVVRGWKDFYRNHYTFRGYQARGVSIPASEVTLCHERDIILNLNHVIPEKELPRKGSVPKPVNPRDIALGVGISKGGSLDQYADIALSRLRELKAQPETDPKMDKFITVMLFGIGIGLVVLLIKIMIGVTRG